VTRILEANDRVAEENRRMFEQARTYVIDIIGSPGAGKTMLLEASIPDLLSSVRIGVIAGDIETTLDAQRISAFEVAVVQATTGSFGGSCHLEASTVRQAADQMDLSGLDLLFVENVGNLVCPAEFDIGHQKRVVLLSVTEGEDKPLKYPLAFRAADLAVVNKTDLIPHLDVDMASLRGHIRQVNPQLECIELSAKTGEGIDSWIAWIRNSIGVSAASARR
jgi:hydrogenase nickel incorporation protein HypB